MLNPRLTIKHLQMLQTIAGAETMTRAAQILNVSQPALSSRLNDAEAILGTKLFVRRGRRLTLSAPGQMLLRAAHSILDELTQVENALLNLPDQVGQVLRIGMPQYASFSWLPTAIKAFESSFPNVELQIVSEAALQPRAALLRNEVDVALVSSPSRTLQVDNRRFRCQSLFADEFVALLPADHEKAAKPFLIAEDFLSETYITNSSVPEKNREYELFFQAQGVSPERVVQVGFTEAILELVAAGIGTTIMTRWIMESHARHDRLVSLPLNESGLGLYWFAICSRKKEIEDHALFVTELIAQHRPGGNSRRPQ